MMPPAVELALIVCRYLRQCDRSGDGNALTDAGLPPSDRHLLTDKAYWTGIAFLKPAVTVDVAIDWDALWSQISDDPPVPDGRLAPAEDLIPALCDHYRSCALNPKRLVELADTGVDTAMIEQILAARIPPFFAAANISAVTISLQIDRHLAERIQKYVTAARRELKQHLRLVSSGATYDLMKHLTGTSTHEFSALRKINALDKPRGRLPQLSSKKIKRILKLISLVCPDGEAPGIDEYLKLCDHTVPDELDLGEIHAAIRQDQFTDRSTDDGI